MRELVFLLEEPSAKAMLESLLPRMLQEDIRFRCMDIEPARSAISPDGACMQ